MEFNVIIKNAIFLNIIHNTFNLGDTEIVICIILVLINRADSLNHYLNIQGIVRYNSENNTPFGPKFNCQYHFRHLFTIN
jgi:hypothetical protein